MGRRITESGLLSEDLNVFGNFVFGLLASIDVSMMDPFVLQ